MESKRQKQVGEVVRRNFSIVLQNEGGYIYGTEPMVTVTSVKVSPDMGIAKVYLSVYNTEDKQSVILQMDASNQKLRQSLAHRVKRHMRRVPELHFYLDDTLDEMYRLNGLFNRLGEDNPPENDLDDLSKEL